MHLDKLPNEHLQAPTAMSKTTQSFNYMLACLSADIDRFVILRGKPW